MTKQEDIRDLQKAIKEMNIDFERGAYYAVAQNAYTAEKLALQILKNP